MRPSPFTTLFRKSPSVAATYSTHRVETAGEDPQYRLSLVHVRVHLISTSYLFLSPFSNASALFRFVLKSSFSVRVIPRTHVLTQPQQPVEDHVSQAWTECVLLYAREFSSSPFVSFSTLSQLADTPFASVAGSFTDAYAKYCEQHQLQETGVSAEAFFRLEESLLVAGMDAVYTIVRTRGRANESASAVNPEKSETSLVRGAQVSDLVATFRCVYETLISGLPDVTFEDYEHMDSFFRRIDDRKKK